MHAINFKKIKIEYIDEKGRFLLFAFALFLVLFVAYFLFRIAYGRYEMNGRLMANIDKALYLFGSDSIQFNLEPEGIVPSDDPYVYRFSVANFTESKDSDVDISYSIRVRTTTNLPITVEMYRNELYNSPGAVNIFDGCLDVQDADGAWYHVYNVSDEFEMLYTQRKTDVYSLVIRFPSAYASDTTYANAVENIEVTLKSKQMV